MPSALHEDVFTRPKLRNGVALSFEGDAVECAYRDQGCRIEGGDDGPHVQALLSDLQAGDSSVEDLVARYPQISDQIREMLDELDSLGLLTEGCLPEVEGVLSGAQFYRELRRFADRFYGRTVPGSFYQAMVNGSIVRQQLIGYVLEYYHVVSLAPRLLAPALAKEEPPVLRSALQSFLASELHHDRMVLRSLKTVGIRQEDLVCCQPLPTTFAICASLGAYATQNPLTFKALLYLFEEPAEEFNEAFETACRRCGLPTEFIEPILAHARLNDDGDHADISAVLLGGVPVVGPAEQHLTKKHLAIAIETMAMQDEEIMAYYGDPDAVVPRVFR